MWNCSFSRILFIIIFFFFRSCPFSFLYVECIIYTCQPKRKHPIIKMERKAANWVLFKDNLRLGIVIIPGFYCCCTYNVCMYGCMYMAFVCVWKKKFKHKWHTKILGISSIFAIKWNVLFFSPNFSFIFFSSNTGTFIACHTFAFQAVVLFQFWQLAVYIYFSWHLIANTVCSSSAVFLDFRCNLLLMPFCCLTKYLHSCQGFLFVQQLVG